MIGHVVGPRAHGGGRRHPRGRGCGPDRARRRQRRPGGAQRRRQDVAPQGPRRHVGTQGRRHPAARGVRLPAPGSAPGPDPRPCHGPHARARRAGPRRPRRPARGAAAQDGGTARRGRARPEVEPRARPVRARGWVRGRVRGQAAPCRPGPAPGPDETRDHPPPPLLSGGDRRRVELARILFAGSELLLLDEPTNHLDNDAREWLFGFLRSYPGALVIISHDLELLDESITRVLHLDRPGEADVGELTEYKGTYSQYRAARERDEARLAKLAVRQQAEIARLQTLVDRWGAKASKASFAHALETRIGRIRNEQGDAPSARRGLRSRRPGPPPSGRTSLEVAGLAKSSGDGPPVFEDVDFTVGRGER